MDPKAQGNTSRRQFLKNTGRVAAASALAGVALPHVHAAENNTLQLALIGCGGRGTGAAANALATKSGPTKLVAMADIFDKRLASSHDSLKKEFGNQIDVPGDRRFIGFDGYQKAMDCLKPGDVALFTTPPAFRWVHFGYAIQKGLNVFMEKPVTVDGPTTRKVIALADQATKKNLKVGVGLMVRHCRARYALLDRIRQGEIGEIMSLRAYRMGGGAAGYFGPKPKDTSELLYQTRGFHGFLWASGGIYSDFYIHQIDECSWVKGAWPVKAMALGGHLDRRDRVDQNLDAYSVEYVFPDGTRLYYYGQQMPGCHDEFASYVHGTKGVGVISTYVHTPGKCRIYQGYNLVPGALKWAFPQPEQSPYQLEWDDLMDAIRNDKPYNEAKRGAEASLVTSMGRMAAHTGQIVTYDEILNSDHEFAPGVDKLTMDSPAPLPAGPDGKYPIPQPGILTKREY
jgi:predicted dehydrogenase